MMVPLAHETFKKLCDLIYRRMGLAFPDNKKYLLESRLQLRLVATHCRTFEEYYQYLQFDPQRDREFVELANCVTTNETYFFRDQVQIDCLKTQVLPQAIARRERERRLRIWSAGCSSGEEAYTLAILLVEEFPELKSWRTEIVGTDISEQMLHKARTGSYGAYSVRNVRPDWLKKYFRQTDGQYMVDPCLKTGVRFSLLNLFDRAQMRTMRDFDLVLCRNVLIYFDEHGRKQIVSGFYDALNDTGVLIIGFSESLHGLSRSFHPVPWHKTIVYHKAGVRLPIGANGEPHRPVGAPVSTGTMARAGWAAGS